MTLVVDASVAVRWTIATPLSQQAEQLLRARETLIAPDFIIVEVTNAFCSHLRKRADRVQRAVDGIEFLPRWFAELVPAVGLRHRAMALALDLHHPAYDCFYLALAASRGAKLVTTDEHLIRKVHGSEHSRLAVHLSDWRPGP